MGGKEEGERVGSGEGGGWEAGGGGGVGGGRYNNRAVYTPPIHTPPLHVHTDCAEYTPITPNCIHRIPAPVGFVPRVSKLSRF